MFHSDLITIFHHTTANSGHNNLNDLSITVSHLLAIYNAIYHPLTDSPYALIAEDDVIIPFDIDYTLLASTAPTGFGILRLYVGNEIIAERLWIKYIRSFANLWTPGSDRH